MSPHDLIHVRIASRHLSFEESSALAFAALAVVPVVVVRRALPREGWIPIGARGLSRAERYAGWLRPGAVVKAQSPEDLRGLEASRDLPAFEALGLVAERWREVPLAWGPCGSVGFELACGAPAVNVDSDLDLQLRAPAAFSRQHARDLLGGLEALPANVDVQVETPCGGFSLLEFAHAGSACLLRTNQGPRLVRCPWEPAE